MSVYKQIGLIFISIHALCEEGDLGGVGEQMSMLEISIHALCEEGDGGDGAGHATDRDFYPRPLRGGRRGLKKSRCGLCYFYPRPLRGGRQQKQRQNLYFQTNYTTFCTNLEEP